LIISQEEIYKHVFHPLQEEKGVDNKFVVQVLIDYIRSLALFQISVEPFIYELLVNFLVRNNKFYQLHQLLQYHVVADSVHVACQLLSLESINSTNSLTFSDVYPPAYQLALDMFKRLGSNEQILEVMLAKKQVLPALRFAKNHKELKLTPALFFEGAIASRNPTIFYHVLHHFQTEKGSFQPENWQLYEDKFVQAMKSDVKK
jgi:hypothetical protein